MKSRRWLNLALLAIVAAFAVFAYLKPQSGASDYRLSQLKSLDAARIKLEIPGTGNIDLERTASGWRLNAPLAARADDFQVARLLGILEATAKDRFPAAGLARFDLNESSARLTINGQSFSFGAVNQLSREQYVLTEGGVYLIALRYGAALTGNALELASKQLFAPDETPTAFAFSDFTLEQHDGRWQLTPAAEVGADDINRWVDEWRIATALEVLPGGNRKPLAEIKVRLKSGAELAISVLQREPALILARSDQKLEYRFSEVAAKRLLTAPAASVK